jgi:hypothetical protein
VVRSGRSRGLLHSLFYCRLIFITLKSYPSIYCDGHKINIVKVMPFMHDSPAGGFGEQ